MRSQPHDDCEIVVVDDGSTDGTSDIVQARFGDAVRIIKQPNAGPGTARNRGAAESKGEYIAFIDSDDVWFPWTLGTYRDVLSAERHPSIVTSVPFAFYADEELPRVACHFEMESFSDFFSGSRTYRSFGSCVLLVRRTVFADRSGFVTQRMNGEDLDFILRAGDAPGFVEITSPPLVGWRQHEANLTGDVAETAAGLLHIVESERRGLYPGGKARRLERREIIARHVRSAALAAARKQPALAWQLYRAALPWQIRLRRWKFCSGLPVAALAGRIQGVVNRTPKMSLARCVSR